MMMKLNLAGAVSLLDSDARGEPADLVVTVNLPRSREGESDRLVKQLNSLAARLAQSHGVLIADGFTPMQGTAASTTHMLDNPPDIHPRAIGFDILAAALLDALPRLPKN